jgi:hypothetical protein
VYVAKAHTTCCTADSVCGNSTHYTLHSWQCMWQQHTLHAVQLIMYVATAHTTRCTADSVCGNSTHYTLHSWQCMWQQHTLHAAQLTVYVATAHTTRCTADSVCGNSTHYTLHSWQHYLRHIRKEQQSVTSKNVQCMNSVDHVLTNHGQIWGSSTK